MAAYLLTWNPNAWAWDELPQSVETVEKDGVVTDSWSAGVTKRIVPNDRFYLMQLGGPTRGIVGAGYFASIPYYAPHWNGIKGDLALYCQVEFNQLVSPPEEYLATHQELTARFPEFNWSPRASGVSVPLPIAEKLDEMLGQGQTSDAPLYEEGAPPRFVR